MQTAFFSSKRSVARSSIFDEDNREGGRDDCEIKGVGWSGRQREERVGGSNGETDRERWGE